eukprot:2726202-Karenia_brevis.AAC.1
MAGHAGSRQHKIVRNSLALWWSKKVHRTASASGLPWINWMATEGVPDPPNSPLGSQHGDMESQFGGQHIRSHFGSSHFGSSHFGSSR